MSSVPNSATIGDSSPCDKLSLEMSWDALKELGASERHFNGLETDYRKLASCFTGTNKVVTTRLRWFCIVLTAVPIAFAAKLFVVWCGREFSLTAASIAAGASLACVGFTTLMIWNKGAPKATAGS